MDVVLPTTARVPGRQPGAAPATTTAAGAHGTIWVTVLIAAVLALAVWLIFADLGERSLSHAEAYRARRILEGGWAEGRRFPPLLFLLLDGLTQQFGRSEWVFRFPSALAGMLTAVAMALLCWRRYDVATAIAGAALVSFHPMVIAHARELKVFAIEILMTTLLLHLGSEVCRKGGPWSWVKFTAGGLLGLGLTFTSVLVIAAWWPLLLGKTLVERSHVRGITRALIFSSLCLMAAGVFCHWWVAGFSDRGPFIDYYYTVVEPSWPEGYGISTLAWWAATKSYGALQYALGISYVWSPLCWVMGTLGLFVLCVGIGVTWSKAPSMLFACLLLFAAALAAGAVKAWPIGNVRHSAFMIAPIVVLGAAGLAEACRRLGRSPATVLLVLVCVLIPAARAVKAGLRGPVMYEHVRPVIEYTADRAVPGQAVLVYYGAADAFAVYWARNDVRVVEQPSSDRDRPEQLLSRIDTLLATYEAVWFISTHDWRTERQDWLELVRARYPVLDEVATADADGVLLGAADPKKSTTVGPPAPVQGVD